MFRHLMLIIGILCSFVVPIASAQTNTQPPRDNKDKQAQEAVPFVSNAYGIDPKTGDHIPVVRLGERIRVKVENFDALQRKQRADCKEGAPCQEKQIRLFLNLMEIKGIRPVLDPKTNEFEFRLLRRDAIPEYLDNKQQKAVWAALFGFSDTMKWAVPVNVSVGLEDGTSLPSNIRPLTLVRLESNNWLLLYCVILAGILILYGVGFSKGLFSDRGATENGTPALSLARVQMGLWFFLVVAAFLFIWLVIGELLTIPASVLSLIGIAGGTSLGAAMIDSSKRAQASAKVKSEEEKQKAAGDLKTTIEAKIKERDQIKAALEGLSAQQQGNAALIELKKQHFADLSKTIGELEGELRTLGAQLPGLKEKSDAAKVQRLAVSKRNLFDDLFSDESGWSFHRVQMGVWTLVLSFVFVGKVLENLAMPEFDTTLLALMGISSGTYLGFKLPEQQPAATKTS